MGNLVFTATLSTDCVCEYESDEGETVDNYGCSGDCWEWSREDFDLIVEGAFSSTLAGVMVTTNGRGWMRQSETFIVETSVDTVAEVVRNVCGLNGDYRLEATTLSECSNELSVVRYSHDEPTGASFNFIGLNYNQLTRSVESGVRLVD